MSIIRVERKERWTTVSNIHINDDRLSWKATAILTYLLSKPNDWTVYIKQLAKAKKDGIKAVYSGIKELKEYGYIEHRFIHAEDGKITHGEYIVHEEPIDVETPVNRGSEPYTQNGNAVKSNAVKRTLLNTNNKLNTNNDDIQPPDPQPPTPKSDPPELMALVPEKFRTPAVEQAIKNGLKVNTVDFIKAAILYSVATSHGDTVSKFKAYLGKAIDLGWAVGWEPERKQISSGPDIDFAKLDEQSLKFMVGAGNVLATIEFERRKAAQ